MTLYLILIAHWVADFIAQTDKMAVNKSTSMKWLASHVLTYTSIMMLACGPLYGIINGAAHLVIDFFTSRATSYLWKKGDRHNFFVVIGLDQLLHTIVLIATIKYAGWY